MIVLKGLLEHNDDDASPVINRGIAKLVSWIYMNFEGRRIGQYFNKDYDSQFHKMRIALMRESAYNHAIQAPFPFSVK